MKLTDHEISEIYICSINSRNKSIEEANYVIDNLITDIVTDINRAILAPKDRIDLIERELEYRQVIDHSQAYDIIVYNRDLFVGHYTRYIRQVIIEMFDEEIYESMLEQVNEESDLESSSNSVDRIIFW
ncbi:MAG: hypothetical protein GY751_03875 [Bacteroidetes bacterium]|nr:hypothetical protein [Bacteroidota bacterium]